MNNLFRETDNVATLAWPRGMALLGLTVLYFALARLGLLLASVHGSVSPVWPATGLAIGALLIGGYRLWPGVALGAFAANAATSVSWLTAAGIAVGNTLEALVGAAVFIVLRRALVRFKPMEGPLAFVGASTLAPVISASIGVATLFLTHAIPSAIVITLWKTWWIGDALGALLVAPFILAWRGTFNARPSINAAIVTKAVALAGITLLVGGLTFGGKGGGGFLFAIFPLLLLAAGWFGSTGAKTVAVLTSAVGIGAAFAGTGPFVDGTLNDNLIHLQLFLTSVAVAALVFPGLMKSSAFALPIGVMLVGWTLSGWMFSSLQDARVKIDHAHFQALLGDATEKITQRFTRYEDALQASVALFGASQAVDREEWAAFSRDLRMREKYPGALGIGVAFIVLPAELDAFLARTRADGAPDFAVKNVPNVAPSAVPPDGPVYHLITYCEPAEANREAIGLNIATEAIREMTALTSRDSGKAGLTMRIQLIQDDNQRPGALLLVPFYRNGSSVETIEERRAAAAGWIYAPIATQLLLQNVLGDKVQEIGLRFFEGKSSADKDLLYDSTSESGHRAPVERTTEVGLAGQTFTLSWSRAPGFVAADESAAAWAGTSAAFISLLLAALVMSLQSAGRKARTMVLERTAELELSNQRLRLEGTERQRAESSLRESDRLQRAILESANYAIISTTREGIIRTFNPAAERLLGYAASEVIGKSTPELIHDADEVRTRALALAEELGYPVAVGFEAFVAKAKNAGIDECEWTYIRKDGSRFPVLISVTALRDENREITGFLGIASDLTARKEAEVRTRRALDELARQKFAVDQHAIVAVTDMKGTITYANEKFCAISGYTRAELMGQNHRLIKSGHHSPDFYREMFQTIARGEVWQGEICNRNKNGDLYWVASTIVPFVSADGSPTQYVAIRTDITERKRAEEKSAQNEQLIRAVTDRVPGLVAYWSGDLRCAFANRAYFEWFGRKPEEMVGIPMETLLGPALFRENEPYIRGVLAGKPQAFERTLRKPNGELGYTWSQYVPDVAADGVTVKGFCVLVSDVTEVKARDTALRESAQRIRLAADAAGIGIWEWDLSSNHILWDQRMFELYGRESSEGGDIDYASWASCIVPDDLDAQEKILRDLVQGGGHSAGEFRIRRFGDGALRNIYSSQDVIENDEGRAIRVVGVNMDITQRTETARAINESEERFRSAFEFAGSGMAIVELDGRFQKVNRTLCDIVGYSEGELLEKTFQELTHPDDLDADLAYLRSLLAGEARFYQMEKRYLHRDGHIVWIRLTGSLVRTADGAPLQFIAQIEDVTERKQIEQALGESEERTRLFAEHAPASVAMFDRGMHYLVVSRQWLADYHLENAKIIGRTHYEVFPEVPETWKEIHRRCLAGAVETNESERFQRSDGSAQWLRWEVRPWYKGPGEIGGIVMFTQDITLRRELEVNLAKARDEALESSRLKSEFLATMSHEIRTPMNGVIGMSGLLLQSSLDRKQREMAQIIVRSAENLLTIINDILDFSKIEAGKFRIDPVDFNLRDAVEETVALLAPQVDRKSLELVCDIDPALATHVHGDCGRIQQVLTNLLGNALKFTEAGEVRVTARAVPTAGPNLQFRIEVKDTGIGIDESTKPHLFQPFTQADGSTTRRFGGTGLGLAICGQLIALMGGKLGYESTEGIGSCFWFELDLRRATSPPPELADRMPDGARVLIVDDHEANRTLLLRQLATLGLSADAVPDFEQALAALGRGVNQNNRYTVALLDWNMPRKDGLMLAQAIRADPRIASTCLIVLTSAAPTVAPETMAGLSFDAVLTKPVRETQLRRSLLRAFGKRETPAPFVSLPNSTGRRLRLLVAEDNPTNQTVAQMMIEQLGHSIEIANNGQEALEKLAYSTYDAILMDCQMPVMDGYETTRRIRAGLVPGGDFQIPIIALTASAMPGDRAKALGAGMDDYVSKPLDTDALQAAFARCGLLQMPTHAPAEPNRPMAHPPVAPAEEPMYFDPVRRQQLETIKSPDGVSLWEKALGVFLKEMPTRMTSLAVMTEERQADKLATVAHTLAGSASSLGATALHSAAQSLEVAARAPDWDNIRVCLNSIEIAWLQMQAETKNH